MPRIRSIPPEVCELESLARVSSYADRTFVRLWTHADDYGRCKDDARLIVAQLYPLDERMTRERVEKDLAELEAEGLLHRYQVDGKGYLCIDHDVWSWQKPRRKVDSKHPPCTPPDNVRTGPANRRTRPAGEVDGGGGGVGDGDGVAPTERFTRGLSETTGPQAVDNRLPIDLAARAAERAAHAALDAALEAQETA